MSRHRKISRRPAGFRRWAPAVRPKVFRSGAVHVIVGALSVVVLLLLGLTLPSTATAASNALDTFKLQLPTGSNGHVDEVKRDALVGGYSSTYFQPAPDGMGWRFHTPVGGVHTSGSQYARTELREVNPDGSNAGWRSDGTTRTFRAVYKVTHLPAGDREVTLFQIHNGTTEAAAVRISDTGKAMQVVVRKNGHAQSPVLDPAYVYGRSFDVQVSVNDRVRIWFNGRQRFDYPLSDLSGGPFYLKAGDYLQATPSTASASDFGDVELRLPSGASHFLTRTSGAAQAPTVGTPPADQTTTPPTPPAGVTPTSTHPAPPTSTHTTSPATSSSPAPATSGSDCDD